MSLPPPRDAFYSRASADHVWDKDDAENCCCTWSRDLDTGRPLICVAGQDAKIKVYDVTNGEVAAVGCPMPQRSCAFSAFAGASKPAVLLTIRLSASSVMVGCVLTLDHHVLRLSSLAKPRPGNQ